MMPTITKNIHWRYALLTVLRLRKTGGLVEEDVLQALKITLRPPSSPTAATPDLINQIRFFMSDEDEPSVRKGHIEYARNNALSPIAVGSWNCECLMRAYENISDRRGTGGYYTAE